MKQSKNKNKLGEGVFILAKLAILLAWSMLIIALMTQPFAVPDNLEDRFTLYDKVVHVFMFGGLTLIWLFIWQEFKWFVLSKAVALSLGFGLGFAIFMEYIQQYVPGRMSDLWDLIFGVLGMLMAVLLHYIYWYRPKPKLLLHVCCATCGVYVSQLLGKDYRVYLFYSNSNIAPRSEYDKRLAEVKRISKKLRLPLVADRYNHKYWLKRVKGHEHDAEKGERCHICYEYRLEQTAKQAKKMKIKYFTSTLSVSPHKLAKVINDCGQGLASQHGLEFLVRDFKKQDGFKKSMALAKKFNFYRQNYCGCEFSKRDSLKRK